MKLVGGKDTPLNGYNITSEQRKVVNASDDLFYDVIPFEMLRTYETKPQVLVTVGEYPAVCHSMNCDYNYVIPQGEVTSFIYEPTTRLL